MRSKIWCIKQNVDILPQTVDLVMFWSEEELKELEGTYALGIHYLSGLMSLQIELLQT